MTATYEAIATTTLSSAQSSVTFSSISGSFTDLVLIVNQGFSTNAQDMICQVNNDTGSNYSGTQLLGNGSSASSARWSNSSFFYFDYNGGTNALQNTYIINFMNYSNTTTNKTVLSRFNDASRGVEAIVGLWRSTAAISTIKVYPSNSHNFITGSTFTLYGIKAE